ncbi:MAG: LamG domain-containing protein [Niabella sp.]
MKRINIFTLLFLLTIFSCQKMERPPLSDYPKDANPPGGPLKFYAAFDGTIEDPLRNAVDSIRANFASENPLKSIDGISGKAVQGELGKEIKYASANDFIGSSSFSVSFWMKHNTPPATESQFVFCFPTTVGHWSGSTMFLLIDHAGAGTTASLAVAKFFVLDKKGEKWFEFVGDNRIPNIFDNNWHHFVFVYDEVSSVMTLYKDGVAFKSLDWAGHGKIEVDVEKVSGFKIGGKTTDWGETWQGGLDQFRLYGTAISAEEVQQLYVGKK